MSRSGRSSNRACRSWKSGRSMRFSEAFTRLALFAIVECVVPHAAAQATNCGRDLLFGDYEPPPAADPAAAANALVKAAQEDYKAEKYLRAIARLERAYQLKPTPRVLFNL